MYISTNTDKKTLSLDVTMRGKSTLGIVTLHLPLRVIRLNIISRDINSGIRVTRKLKFRAVYYYLE